MNEKLSFSEIFLQEGLYISNGFAEGHAFRIIKNLIDGRNELELISYDSKDTITPSVYKEFKVYKELFDKQYIKVFTRQSLFSNDK